jgi:hypothetical protein
VLNKSKIKKTEFPNDRARAILLRPDPVGSKVAARHHETAEARAIVGDPHVDNVFIKSMTPQTTENQLSVSPKMEEMIDSQDFDLQLANSVDGTWTYEERYAFLREWDRTGLTSWDEMAEILFTRYVIFRSVYSDLVRLVY